jgi:hypothetical protein
MYIYAFKEDTNDTKKNINKKKKNINTEREK